MQRHVMQPLVLVHEQLRPPQGLRVVDVRRQLLLGGVGGQLCCGGIGDQPPSLQTPHTELLRRCACHEWSCASHQFRTRWRSSTTAATCRHLARVQTVRTVLAMLWLKQHDVFLHSRQVSNEGRNFWSKSISCIIILNTSRARSPVEL